MRSLLRQISVYCFIGREDMRRAYSFYQNRRRGFLRIEACLAVWILQGPLHYFIPVFFILVEKVERSLWVAVDNKYKYFLFLQKL